MPEGNPYDHFCGLNGFDPYRDTCPACSYNYYRGEGVNREEAIIKVYTNSGLPTREQHQRTVEFVKRFVLEHK